MIDQYNEISPAQSIAAVAVTAAVNGGGVDLAGYNSATVVVDAGIQAGTAPTTTLKIQDSPDNSTFTDVAAADLIGGVLPVIDVSNDVQIHKRGYIGNKRYLRVICSAVSGTSPSLPLSAGVIRGRARKQPV